MLREPLKIATEEGELELDLGNSVFDIALLLDRIKIIIIFIRLWLRHILIVKYALRADILTEGIASITSSLDCLSLNEFWSVIPVNHFLRVSSLSELLSPLFQDHVLLLISIDIESCQESNHFLLNLISSCSQLVPRTLNAPFLLPHHHLLFDLQLSLKFQAALLLGIPEVIVVKGQSEIIPCVLIIQPRLQELLFVVEEHIVVIFASLLDDKSLDVEIGLLLSLIDWFVYWWGGIYLHWLPWLLI